MYIHIYMYMYVYCILPPFGVDTVGNEFTCNSVCADIQNVNACAIADYAIDSRVHTELNTC